MIDPNFLQEARILLGFVVLIWLLEILDQLVLRHRLNRLGIRPRSQIGLRGILFAPLLHGTWQHLSANTVPFVVLGGLVMLGGLDEFAIVTTVVWLVSGLGVWLFAPSNSLHIGASGLIFGYFGFLLLRSYFQQDLTSGAIALLVLFFYSPLIWGILPIRRGISWQGHLFGFVGGGLAARYLPQLRQWLELGLELVRSSLI
ncbi:MAG: rhomboid family intramembrane serine protease [Leptolyngbyaceae cyanobacterium SM1_3_5]|nr:rhomboid family intramembrane serine protease [Leptolyngbyaceae cyanobacterium SM1_3_5]